MSTSLGKRPWWEAVGVGPVFSMFFLEAFVLGNWIPRIPDVKTMFGFSASQLGLCLFVLASGTVLAFLAGGYLLKKIGVRLACAFSLPVWTVGITGVPFMPNGTVLGIWLFCAGIGIGVLEIAMNTAADRLEHQAGRRLMSKAHGFWSLGSLVGALSGAAIAASGFDIFSHFTTVLIPTAVISVMLALRIPRAGEGDKQANATEPAAVLKLPDSSLIMLCIMPVGIMIVEGSFIDWSALFVRDVLHGNALESGLIFAAFALVMTITRMSGDWLLDRYGPLRVARVSALSAGLGTALFALAPNVPVGFVGALLAGLGTAIFYPLTMTAAANRPGDSEDNVAAMSLFAFSTFMIAPPALGGITDIAGMRVAIFCIVPLALMSFLLSSELKRRR